MKEGSGERMVEWRKSGYERYFIYYQQEEFAEILKNSGFEVIETSKKPPVKTTTRTALF